MVNIVLTIDADTDYFDQSFQPAQVNPQPAWRGVEEGVPLLKELFASYKGSDGSPCVATWFVRADDQIGYYYGANSFLFNQYKDYWQSLHSKGDEIAWHPHLYKFESGSWIQQTDPLELKDQLFSSLDSVRAAGWNIISSRIGEAYFSNLIGKALSALNIKCDSSCLPGRKRTDGTRTIDWLNSPTTPYNPSEKDYRIPGEPQIPLLEIPFSMVEVLADYDKGPLKRYVDISFWHRALKNGLDDALVDNRLLNIIIHPSTILPSLTAKNHGLLSFRLEEVRKNLDHIVETLERRSVKYNFITMSQVQLNYSDSKPTVGG